MYISSQLTNSWSRHGLQLLANRKAPQRQHSIEGMGSHTSQRRWISDIKRGKSRASHSQDFTRLHSSPNSQTSSLSSSHCLHLS
uniref:Uncharacterized protein n=1 Tax=Triticum urartu TaxID=4572 RepID=A0A8R7PVA2_TRIUA